MTPEEKQRIYAEWKEKQNASTPPPSDPPRPAPSSNPLPEPDLPPDLAEKRRRNREKHPDVAAFVDECRQHFGDVEVVSFEER